MADTEPKWLKSFNQEPENSCERREMEELTGVLTKATKPQHYLTHVCIYTHNLKSDTKFSNHIDIHIYIYNLI